MKDRNEFDELARRKLKERQFAFDEADWMGVEQMLDRGSRSSPAAWWITSALVVLLGLGAGIYFFNASTGTSEIALISEDHGEPDALEGRAEKMGTSLDGPGAAAKPEDTAAVHKNIPQAEITETTVEAASSSLGEKAGQASHGPPAHEQSATRTDPFRVQHPAVLSQDSRPIARASMATSHVSEEMVGEQHPGHEPQNKESNDQDPGVAIHSTTTPTAGSDLANEQAGTANGDHVPAAGSEQVPSVSTSSTPPANAVEGTDGSEPDISSSVPDRTDRPDGPAMQDPTTNIDPISDQEAAGTLPDGSVEEGSMDEASSRQEDPLSDDAPAPDMDPQATVGTGGLPEAPPTPPIVDPRSPLELGIMAGTARPSSTYTGAFDPNVRVEGMNSWSGAVELMRMGRNIGIGGGLHYVQYAERLHAPDVMRTTEQQMEYYFLSAMDTTILMITDSILINGELYYTGPSVNATIHVLQQGAATVTSSERVREARMRINRTDYLEVPLLLDVHVTQGRWQLGLRGGPTAGILTFRRGSIPNTTDDGYVDLQDQQFRSLVFGYTARAYIRHRFNAGWSAGLEPMLRGHLTNGLDGGEVNRRPSALGGMFSLTYRFR